MTRHDDLDQQLLAWLDDPSTPPAPRYLGDVLERTRRTRQRPSWASLERWLPMTVITRPAAPMPLRMAWLLLVGLLVAALVGSVAIVGSRFLTSSSSVDAPAVAAIPVGDEAVFAYGSAGGVFTVRADGGDLRQLTADGNLATHPTWSPDGTRIAYRLWDPNGTDSIVVMDAGGGDPITLATNPQSGDYCVGNFMSLGWSPDGSSLIFPTSDGCTSVFDLNIVATDGSSPATRLLASDEMHSVFGWWSPDGSRIAYMGSEPTGNTGLYVADVGAEGALADGLEGRLVRPDLGPNLLALAADPPLGSVDLFAWSPDGTEIAVTDGMNIDDQKVYIVQADGSGERLLADRASWPQWAPDGERLAFYRGVDPSERFNGRPCSVRTWVIDADGSDERQLDPLEDGCAAPPLWSPDGTRIAAQLVTSTPEEPITGFHLGIVTVDGTSEPVVLSDYWGGSWQPVLAPMPPAPSSASSSPAP